MPTDRVMQEGLDPSPDELRGFPLESRALLSLQPEVRMEGEAMVKGLHESARRVVPKALMSGVGLHQGHRGTCCQ